MTQKSLIDSLNCCLLQLLPETQVFLLFGGKGLLCNSGSYQIHALPASISQVLKGGSIPGRGCEHVEMTTKNLKYDLNLLDEQWQGLNEVLLGLKCYKIYYSEIFHERKK